VLDQTATGKGSAETTMTSSGARVAPLAAEIARSFLQRHDQAVPASIALALGAFEEATLVAVAALGERNGAGAALTLVVDPARRKLRIGSDLLDRAVAEAAALGVRRLLATYAAGTAGVEALLRSSELLQARRRAGNTVTALLFVTSPAAPT
jgi:GNAT superfamily N-acetyltransferase